MRAALWTAVLATALTVAVFFLGSFYLQDHNGHGALATGLLFLPVALATMAGANTAGKALGSRGGRALTAAGMGIAAAGFTVPVLWTSTAGIARHTQRATRPSMAAGRRSQNSAPSTPNTQLRAQLRA